MANRDFLVVGGDHDRRVHRDVAEGALGERRELRIAMRIMGGVISSGPHPHLSGIGARSIAYTALGVLWMLPFWTHLTSCPVGLHDWAYPCLDEQRAAYL